MERVESLRAVKGITEKWKFFSFSAPIQRCSEPSRDPEIAKYDRKNNGLRCVIGRGEKVAGILHQSGYLWAHC